jgi:3-hydroxybutyryl-CoA dehydrogenase
VEKNLRRQLEKGKIQEGDVASTLSRIAIAAEMETAAEAQLVIEAVTEEPETKFGLFRKLDGICPPETVFGSNTSSISITEIAAQTRRPDRVIGIHFMNPVPMMQLVEVIRGIATGDPVRDLAVEITKKLGKTPVEVNDYPGFVSNRILMPMLNEAAFCVMEGVATPEAIDTVMKLGMNHPMGPLALADLIGLDTCLAIMEVLHEGLGDDKYRPCPLLRKMVRAGYLGRKTQRGFYTYAG